MSLIEIIWFVINVVIGLFVGNYFWNKFGFIFAPVGFVIGFSGLIICVESFKLLTKFRNKISKTDSI